MNFLTHTIKITLIVTISLSVSCKDILPPQPEEEPLPSFSRDSEWQLDSISLNAPFFTLNSIWSSGPSNIYAIGGESVFRFNGSSWNFIGLHSSVGGPIGATSYFLSDIYGCSAADVWLAGSQNFGTATIPLIVRYDGSEWKVVQLPGNSNERLNCIWGNSHGTIWAGGSFGTIFNYNGISWTQEQLSFQPTSGDSWFISDIAGYPTTYALIYLTNSTSPVDVRYLVKRVGNKWELLDSLSSTAYRCSKLYMSPGGTLYSSGRDLCLWDGSAWQQVRGGSDASAVFQVTANFDENMFIARGSVFFNSGFIEHYNGTDWLPLATSLSNQIGFFDAFTNGSSLAALGMDSNQQFYVLRSQ